VTCTPYVKFKYIFQFLAPTLPIHYVTFIELWWRIRGVLSLTSNVKGQIERKISYWWTQVYLQPFSRYLALSILRSRLSPFWVTWCHHSHDYLNPNRSFPIGGPLDPSLYMHPFSRYLALSILVSRPWPFWVTWRYRSRDHSNPNGSFPIGGPLDPSLCLRPFSRYLALGILRSRPWPFWVTWRHRSRDYSNPNGPFPINGPLDPSLYLQPFSRYLALSILRSRLSPFWSRDVIIHVIIRIPMGQFLLMVHWTQVSISIRFRDIWH